MPDHVPVPVTLSPFAPNTHRVPLLPLAVILLAAAPAILTASAQDLCGADLSSSSVFTVGRNPASMSISDLDNDGDLDIVTSNGTDMSVTVLKNLGGRDFVADAPYFIGARPRGIGAGDLDGDGLVDVVTACDEVDRLAVFWGQNGDSLGGLEFLSVPPGPVLIRVQDIDNDTKEDVLFVTDSQDSIYIHWGDGTRALNSWQRIGLSFHPGCLAVGDVNGDHVDDIVAASGQDSTVQVLLGTGPRAFAPAIVCLTVPGGRPCQVELGALNTDGFLDIATIDNDPSTLEKRIVLGVGSTSGTFSTSDTALAGALSSAVAISDMNGDGWGDLAVSNEFVDSISLFSGRGDGTMGPSTTLMAGDCPVDLAIDDLDGDQLPDVICLNACASTVSVAWNQPATLPAAANFTPDVVRLGAEGRAIVRLDLPTGVSTDLSPEDVRISRLGTTLGTAISVAAIDSNSVVAAFGPSLLNSLGLGPQTLVITGCDPQGASFSAVASLRVVPGTGQTIWQESLIGAFPIVLVAPGIAGRDFVMTLFDVRGRAVRRISALGGQDDRLRWDGSVDGIKAPTGIYFVRITSGGRDHYGRLVLLR